MSNELKRPELLSPAGSPDKMKAAILYGADAVYLAGDDFGMRAAASNFSLDELKDAVEYAHARGVRVDLTLNTMPHSDEYPKLVKFIDSISSFGIDAVIAADLGVMALVREKMPDSELHVSTQTSTVSAAACREWRKLGAKRVVLARELNLNEVRFSTGKRPGRSRDRGVHSRLDVHLLQRAVSALAALHRSRRQPRTLRSALPLEYVALGVDTA